MTAIFDISRLVSRAQFETPTGIDRFELHYAKWAIDRFQSDLHFVANGPLGHRHVSTEFAKSLVARTAEKWKSAYQRNDSPLLRRVVDAIELGSQAAIPPPASSSDSTSAFRQKRRQALRAVASMFWTPATVPSSSLFVHVSHSGIHKQSAYRWLEERACQPLFYVHDLIPLLRPEFCRQGEADRHRTRIETVLRLHRMVLCNSQATARTLDELAEAKGLNPPLTAILPPGLEDTFLHFDTATSVRTKRPYFVCVGTIEPRKNHALLLEIWRQLVERHGADAPRLVIAGRRGWANSHVFSVLDDLTPFQGSVIEVAGLDDRSIAQLLGGASALLSPSHIEGYGMPVAEALALGTPVIASNIRAHREVSRGRATLIDTLDGRGWLAAIEAHAKNPRRNDRCDPKHWTWELHFDALHRLLVGAKLIAAAGPQRSRAPSRVSPEPIAGAQSCQLI